MNDRIRRLLEVQEKHAALIKAESELAGLPQILKKFDAQRAETLDILDREKAELASMQNRRAQMRLNRRDLEERIAKYKIRLSEVRKNDEYQILSAEIERISKEASDIEDEEIALLMQIDEKSKAVEVSAEKCRAELEEISAEESAQLARKPGLEAAVDSARAEFERAKKAADPNFIDAYLKIFSNSGRLPAVVPLKGDVCGGCFLKLPSDVSEIAAKEENSPVFCEQCGRIIYV